MGKYISIHWHTEDVLEVSPDLSEHEAEAVLLLAKWNHDATIGINWDTLEHWARYIEDHPEAVETAHTTNKEFRHDLQEEKGAAV